MKILKSPIVLLLSAFLYTHISAQNYALFFAVNEYQEAGWKDLKNPINDATVIASELESVYNFKTELIINPNKREILTTLQSWQKKSFEEHAHLLVFFSGHGTFNEMVNKGYFIPSSGKSNDPFNESHIELTTIGNAIAQIPCDHILLMIDGCYAGTIDQEVAFKGSQIPNFQRKDDGEAKRIQRLIQLQLVNPSRLLLTSGGKERTPDGEKHSPFVHGFLKALRETYTSKKGFLTYNDLMGYMDDISPLPHYGELPNHEGGGFIFLMDDFQMDLPEEIEESETKEPLVENLTKSVVYTSRIRALTPNGATGSNQYGSGYHPLNAVDENPDTYWCSTSGLLTGQELKFMFETPKEFHKLEFYVSNPEDQSHTHITETQVYVNGKFHQQLNLTWEGNTSSAELEPIIADNITLVINKVANSAYYYTWLHELKIFGRELQDTPDPYTYRILKPVNVEPGSEYGPGYDGEKAVDGQVNTYWSNAAGRYKANYPLNEYLKIDFGSENSIAKIRLYRPENSSGKSLKKAELFYDDGSSQVVEFRGLIGWEEVLIEPKSSSSIELVIEEIFPLIGSDYVGIYEIEFYERIQ